MGTMGHTVIQVDVPELEAVVRSRLTAASPAMRVAQNTVCAHVTLLGPFVDRGSLDAEVLGRVGSVLASIEPFAFELAELSRFAGGPSYLAPRPAAPFLRLTAALAEAFPGWPPYGGMFGEVVPHLGIGYDLTDRDLDALQALLPVRHEVRQASITWWSPESIETLATLPLRAGLEFALFP